MVDTQRLGRFYSEKRRLGVLGNNVREIKATDYHDIYLLNQDFNPNLHLFSEEKVKKKIQIIIENTFTKDQKNFIKKFAD
ncbi:hypothetical protein LMZ02_30320 [Paenibacillus macerans]|uniref:hypothetical protein n=1 Tax=Paenibacillus macerans TaxID=44252 RepID=UPI001D13244B|nr:hypothetical protein [Paenibacillus macerans]MEC0333713.1 hypothetical protein [Paenibacillus macerans]UMV47662.1 hypothetical protein LMZ02_30320 [Paenibacillus macerans]